MQLWIAMCVYLLLSYIKFVNRLSWSLNDIVRVLQLNPFVRRSMSRLLMSQSDPFARSLQIEIKFA